MTEANQMLLGFSTHFAIVFLIKLSARHFLKNYESGPFSSEQTKRLIFFESLVKRLCNSLKLKNQMDSTQGSGT
jgi:hypothetical protein